MVEYLFGPNQIHTTPQEALDALVEDNLDSAGDSEDFTEANNLVAKGDQTIHSTSAGEPPLRLCHSSLGKVPKPTMAFPLTLQRDSDENVLFLDDGASHCLVGGNATGADIVNHFRIGDGLRFRSYSGEGSGYAIVVNPDRTGGGSAEDWRIGAIEAEGTLSALVVGTLLSLSVERAQLISDMSAGLGTISCDGAGGVFGNFSGLLRLVGNRITGATGVRLITEHCLTDLKHNSFDCYSINLYLTAASAATHILALQQINNIFKAESAGPVMAIDPNYLALIFGKCARNCFYDASQGVGAPQIVTMDMTDFTLAQWHAFSGQEADSIEADPRYNSPPGDLTLKTSSPCLKFGLHDNEVGLEGNTRVLGMIDLGAYQSTLLRELRDYEGRKLTPSIAIVG